MSHPAPDLAALASKILGGSLAVFLSHHDEARAVAPDNAQELIEQLNALAAQRMAGATDEELRHRKEVLLDQYQNAASARHACRGYHAARRPGSRPGRIWKDRSSVNKAGEQRAELDMSRALGERELIDKEIQRRADAQARA
ncbi:hypothetical protein SB14R_10355 [Pseudomonas oryzihabitans]|nr:hypothetical protein SB14R_10355 [Pseudomonas psychrotolerans]